jgi:hypothetical protein
VTPKTSISGEASARQQQGEGVVLAGIGIDDDAVHKKFSRAKRRSA